MVPDVTLTIESFFGDVMSIGTLKTHQDELHTSEETAQRRDEVIKRMLNTPPQPRQAKQKPKEAKERPPKKPCSNPPS